MPWWIWFVCGLALALLEVLLSSGDLFLLLIGAAAFVVGIVDVAGGHDLILQMLVFCVAAGSSLVFFRRRLSDRLKGGVPDRQVDSLLFERARAVDSLEPAAEGRVELRGTNWTARNVGNIAIPSGTPCRVEKVDGLVLWVRPEEQR